MPHEMINGGKYMTGFSGGAKKAVVNSGVIEKCCEMLGQGASFSIAHTHAQGTICHYDSNGKLKGGGTKDKKGGYRIDLQDFTSTQPICANLQIQFNVNVNPSTVACVHVPVGITFTKADLTAAFLASMDALKDGAADKIARLT